MTEMAAPCCVCSDDTGWAENPLVYCDGAGCNLAVHKACYGIVAVPSGNWYCRKCESQERTARVRCELCPIKEGALKRTDSGGWAHVICGLYIPEVRFLNVQTMEPIALSQVPADRYNKVCYICQQSDRASKATVGACMDCNKNGCKLQFHVTCAQSMGLLCEESGNYSDNVKYCGYCQEHYIKLKKGANIKSPHPIRPSSNFNDMSDKKTATANQNATESKQNSKKRFSTPRSSSLSNNSRISMAERKQMSANNLTINYEASQIPVTTRVLSSNTDAGFLSHHESVLVDAAHRLKKSKLNDSGGNQSCSESILPKAPLPEIASIIQAELMRDNGPVSVKIENEASVSLPFLQDNKFPTIKAEPGASACPGETSMTSSVISIAQKSNSTVTKVISGENPINDGNQKRSSVVPCEKSSSSPSSYLTSSTSPNIDLKGTKFQGNTASAPHMLGNQLNPTSSMAQKMFDSLNDELEAHSVFNSAEVQSNTKEFVGPPLFNKSLTKNNDFKKVESLPPSGGTLESLSGSGSNFPQSLEDLLVKQWEQGGTFLMEQAQHFDIASLLTCLHKLRQENMELEGTIQQLRARRDHLLGVNARLAMPLTPVTTQAVNNSTAHSSVSQYVTSPQPTNVNNHNSAPQFVQAHHRKVSVSPQSVVTQSHPMSNHVGQQQPYQHIVNMPSGNDSSRNPPMASTMYSSSTNAIRSSPHPVNRYLPPMENGLPSIHQQQHGRGLPPMSTVANARHLSASNVSGMYANHSAISNPSVVVRAQNPNLTRSDRR